jgi:hypothetical protein
MNNQKIKEIIKGYKQHFKSIHNEEIYKWRAVKRFQENWDIQALDFLIMLDKSFALAKNLLDSGLYYPKRMLHFFAEKETEKVRRLFNILYNEDENLIDRMKTFQDGIKAINKKHFPGKNDYQDPRAILVYLCLRYPDRYYLYKYEMFKRFVQLVDYPYQPKKGDIQNIMEYLTLCDILRAEIIKDNELLELHKTRIKEREYLDSSYHILTQDIIYAAVKHIDKFDQGGIQEPALKRLIKVNITFSLKVDKVVFKGSFTNYIENEKEKKRIGDLGELLVLQHEQEKLKSIGIKKAPEHISKSEGDGLGYDILSYDENRKQIYIEVKTTSKGLNTPFYITRNELERSKKDTDKYFLYRLFEFDDTNNKAKYYVRNGNLSDLCGNPILYRAIVDDSAKLK